MADVRRAVDELLQPERETFWADVWRDVERRERAATKRWRLATLALAAALLTALAATGVVAAPFRHAKSVDRVVDCATQSVSGGSSIDLQTVATRGPDLAARSGRPQEAQLIVVTGGGFGTALLQVDGALKGFLLNSGRCTATRDAAPPRRRGLPLTGVLRAHTLYGHDYSCPVKNVRLRAHIVTGRDGVPTSAQVEVDSPANRALLYVDWKPDLVRVYLSSACEMTGIGF